MGGLHAGGIVFYANYLKFFERSRTEWLRAKGISQQHLRDTVGGIFVVSDAQVRFLKSAKLDDELLVTTSLKEPGRASMTIHQEARDKALSIADGPWEEKLRSKQQAFDKKFPPLKIKGKK